ncbi:MAG: RNHCP domain-containing protein [Patescibacteria group bacterium]|jgi:rubrerythrin
MRKFQRKIEDFICENCGVETKGDGYTDHCPNCLWSKHADINPGDRLSECQGMMRPIGLELKHGEERIVYQCEKCGHRHKVKASKNDDYKKILELSRLEYNI